ncbi:MAG: phosphoenolpyruvate synthase regulatory protein [Micavibrio aeruginosavorus]|uniref:Putative pyruvate, phosphate dikinase regulatory protein n=1 Tax=Micavibrio aeruginosavorus TaxID=349221 RepID=A0A2W5N7T0_9BACT|nr:MAG: phosphoenolpyruvate synthase regulatory protein [Micavibrio aeruginosavorus]
MTSETSEKEPIRDFYIYLISDSTGTTLQGLSNAVLAQFDGIHPTERFWPMVRTETQLKRAMDDVIEHPGPVFFTVMNADLRKKLEDSCRDHGIPCMAVLDPMLRGMSAFLGLPPRGVAGLQHALNEAYFKRMDAVDFALDYDDGQDMDGIENADVILVGVSRTSKTPTCIYLARQGIKAANIPLAMEVPFPEEITKFKAPLFVGLTENPERLVHLRRTRLQADEGDAKYQENTYLDLDRVEEEIKYARRLFSKHGWPVIDVTRRSVEETSAEIMVLLQKHKDKGAKK